MAVAAGGATVAAGTGWTTAVGVGMGARAGRELPDDAHADTTNKPAATRSTRLAFVTTIFKLQARSAQGSGACVDEGADAFDLGADLGTRVQVLGWRSGMANPARGAREDHVARLKRDDSGDVRHQIHRFEQQI